MWFPVCVHRSCDGSNYLTDDRECVHKCENTTFCGQSIVPENYLRVS